MRNFMLVCTVLAMISACSASEVKADLKCLENDDVTLAEAIKAQNYGVITDDLISCAKQAIAAKKAVKVGSGSSGSAHAQLEAPIVDDGAYASQMPPSVTTE